MTPIVSVIIANYNSQKYISDAIKSILNQSFTDFELIIVDDKSTDNSIEIINKHTENDSRIKLFALPNNSGVTYSRQFGLDKAQGKYVAILDSDDISTPTRLQEQVKVFEDKPEVVLVASDYGVISEDGKLVNNKVVHKNPAAIRWYLTFGNCFAHSTIMFRTKTAIELGGYDLAIKRGLDMELSSKLLTKGSAFAIPKILAHWRTYPKSMTKSVIKSELEKNYISSVKNSILLHLNQNVEFETAAAVYFNIKKPAATIEHFNKALDLIRIAYENYSKIYSLQDLVYMDRAIVRHLLKIYERNKNEPWWHKTEKNWANTFKITVKKTNFIDLVLKNISRYSSRNLLNLIMLKVKRVV